MNNSHEKNDPARRLAQVLLVSSDEQGCRQCLDALEDYVTAQLAGEDYTAQMPTVARHLDACVACAEAYALLFEARLAEADQPEPARIPAPDVSFLEPDATAPLTPDQLRVRRAAASLRASLERAVERVGSLLRLRFSQGLLDTLAAAPPAAGPALAFREGSPQGVPLLDLVLDTPDPSVERLHLAAYAHQPDAGRCTLRVRVALPGRDWPDLAGITVLVRFGETQHRVTTDSWGEALIDDVPVAALPDLQVALDLGTVPPTST